MIVRTILEQRRGRVASDDYGHHVGAMGVEALDQYLLGADVTPLNEYMYEDVATIEQALAVAQPADAVALQRHLERLRRRPEWHDPSDGLRTVEALLSRLPADDRHRGVRGDLQQYRLLLEETAASGDEFRLNVVTHE